MTILTLNKEKKHVCGHCGKEIPDNAEFCSYCGEKTIRDDAQDNQGSISMKKIISWLVSIITVLALIIPSVPVSAESGGVERYTVLLLDISSDQKFTIDDRVFYVADSAVDYVKTASKRFVDNVSKAAGNNHIAIVTYYDGKAEVISSFSNDYASLYSKIDGIKEKGDKRSITVGLSAVDDLIQDITDANAITNVVLFTTGMSDFGEYKYDGHYNSDTIGSNWFNEDTETKIYAYSNVAYEECKKLKTKATVYVIGLFQIFENMPSKGEDIVRFFKLFSSELASSPEYFFDVDDPSKLEVTFEEVAEIASTQEDNDNLLGPHNNPGYSFDNLLKDCQSSQYNPGLAYLLADICEQMNSEEELKQVFNDMGFGECGKTWKTDFTDANDLLVSYGIGTQKLTDGTDMVLVSLRGTLSIDDDPMEWLKNILEGSVNDHNEHSSFSDAGRRLWSDVVKPFLDSMDGFDLSNAKIVITGHSHGAAVANIFAALLDDLSIMSTENIYCYTFGCPDSVKISEAEASRYDNIFNICNVNDPVTWIPSILIECYRATNVKINDNGIWRKYGRCLWFSDTSWDDYGSITDGINGDTGLILSEAKKYHVIVIYLRYMRKSANQEAFKNRVEALQAIMRAAEKRGYDQTDRKPVTVVNVFFCLADITIYDSEGNELISIVDKTVLRHDPEKRCYVLFDVDVIYIFIIDINEVDVCLDGTDNGEMYFDVLDGTTLYTAIKRIKLFERVEIKAGKQIRAQKVRNDNLEDAVLYVIDDKGKVISEVMPKGYEEMRSLEIGVDRIPGFICVILGLMVMFIMTLKLVELSRPDRSGATAGFGVVGSMLLFTFIFVITASHMDDKIKSSDNVTTKLTENQSSNVAPDNSQSEDSVYGLKDAEVGSVIQFGHYEQDNNISNGKEPIEWQVLDKEDNRVLVISKYALDYKPYNKEDKGVTWDTCTLREWLNNDFLQTAFSSNEQSLIPIITVKAEKHSQLPEAPVGEDTKDKIFLLSRNEAEEQYFSTYQSRRCAPTDYAISQGATDSNASVSVEGRPAIWWWLRTPVGRCAAIVDNYGYFGLHGYIPAMNQGPIRPAMWISIAGNNNSSNNENITNDLYPAKNKVTLEHFLEEEHIDKKDVLYFLKNDYNGDSVEEAFVVVETLKDKRPMRYLYYMSPKTGRVEKAMDINGYNICCDANSKEPKLLKAGNNLFILMDSATAPGYSTCIIGLKEAENGDTEPRPYEPSISRHITDFDVYSREFLKKWSYNDTLSEKFVYTEKAEGYYVSAEYYGNKSLNSDSMPIRLYRPIYFKYDDSTKEFIKVDIKADGESEQKEIKLKDEVNDALYYGTGVTFEELQARYRDIKTDYRAGLWYAESPSMSFKYAYSPDKDMKLDSTWSPKFIEGNLGDMFDGLNEEISMEEFVKRLEGNNEGKFSKEEGQTWHHISEYFFVTGFQCKKLGRISPQEGSGYSVKLSIAHEKGKDTVSPKAYSRIEVLAG